MINLFKLKSAVWCILLLGALCLVTIGCGSPSPTPEPTPSPEPTGEPETPVGVADPRLGLTWTSSPYMTELAQNYQSDEHEEGGYLAWGVGATWDRWPFDRDKVRKVGDTFQFVHDDINYTDTISYDNAFGLNILAIIDGPVPNPGNPDFDDWAAYVEAIATTYGADIDAWEIGNEWGLPHQSDLSAENYVDILRTTCEVLYDHGQGNKPIVLGSPELFASLFLPQGDYYEHWKEVIRNIAGDREKRNYGYLSDCLDVVGSHVYGRPSFSYDAIVKAKNNIKWGAGVWITEHGVMWRDEDDPEDDNPFANKYRQASYIIQQYVLALVGFETANIDELNPQQAMIFYHRFADANTNNENDRYWGIVDWERDVRYPSYDAMSLVTSLLGNVAAPIDMITDPSQNIEHFLFDKDGQYIHVLWASKQESISGFHITAQGTNPGNCATVHYQPGNGGTEDSNDGRFRKFQIKVNSFNEFVIDLPGSTEERFGDGSDGHPSDEPMIGGPVYILVETNESCKTSSPTGSASLVCDNGRVVGTALRGYDETSGLATLTAACSPGVTYDLSWTQPGRCRVVLIIVLYISPPTAFPTA